MGLGPQAEELRKEVSVLTDYQPNFAIRIFVPTGHHGANCVIYHRDHVQVELLQRDGIAWVIPGGHSLLRLLPRLGKDLSAEHGSPPGTRGPPAAPRVCRWTLKPQATSSEMQLQRSWHAGTALPEAAPRAGALGGLH